MADLVVTAAQVAPVNETQYVAKTYVAAVALTAGLPVYLNSSGKAAIARANATGTIQNYIGIALNAAAAGRPVEVIKEGSVYGLGVGSMAYGAKVYVAADAAGALDDTIVAGTGNFVVAVGMVVPMSDADLTKVVYVSTDYRAIFTAL